MEYATTIISQFQQKSLIGKFDNIREESGISMLTVSAVDTLGRHIFSNTRVVTCAAFLFYSKIPVVVKSVHFFLFLLRK